MTLSHYDEFLLALCLWREARGESIEAQRAIASVIYNRVNDPRWPHSVSSVILQPQQFSSFNANDPNAHRFPKPEIAQDWHAFEQCMQVAAEPVEWLDGVNHYHSMPEGQLPRWHEPNKIVAHIGPFYFLRL